MQIIKRSITLNASGAVTDTSEIVKGRLIAIAFEQSDPEPAQPSTIDLTITSSVTGQAILAVTDQDADAAWYPRTPSQSEVGADVTFDGTNEIYEPFVLFNEAIQLVVAQGTANSKFTMYYAVD